MGPLLRELSRSFADRVTALESEVDSRLGRLEPSKSGIRGALTLVRAYPEAVRESLSAGLDDADTDAQRNVTVRDHLGHLDAVTRLFEHWFARGATAGLPRALARAVDDELILARNSRRAVLTVGPPGEFETYILDLYAQLFGGLDATVAPELRIERFAMIQVPRIEGTQALFRPIVIGHELMHLLLEDRRRGFNAVDVSIVGSPDDAKVRVPLEIIKHYGFPDNPFEAIARSWFEELVCDAYALRRFGPAAVASLACFLDSTAYEDDFTEHPPQSVRLQVLLDALGEVRHPRLRQVLEPARRRARQSRQRWPRWVRALVARIQPLALEIPTVLAGWPARYETNRRANIASWVADRLEAGIPSESMPGEGKRDLLTPSDILNGAWCAWINGGSAPINQLSQKSIDTIEFARIWEGATAGAAVDDSEPEEFWRPQADSAGHQFGGVLPNKEITSRLEGGPGQIHVVPHPSGVQGTALDLRLGTRFIVFEPSGIAAFDPIDEAVDPRVIQGAVEKDWGEPFVLHPGELVLAAAHEYISLPGDVSCLVITRSSYGRLGLVTATAVLVHPYFQGCLTLELVNLGRVPLILTPGERLAQLTFLRVHEPVDPPEVRQKYRCPTGPEFSKIHRDGDAKVLAAIRAKRMER